MKCFGCGVTLKVSNILKADPFPFVHTLHSCFRVLDNVKHEPNIIFVRCEFTFQLCAYVNFLTNYRQILEQIYTIHIPHLFLNLQITLLLTHYFRPVYHMDGSKLSTSSNVRVFRQDFFYNDSQTMQFLQCLNLHLKVSLCFLCAECRNIYECWKNHATYDGLLSSKNRAMPL